jgi:hypothetical protein
MNKYSVIAAGIIAGAATCISAPAIAHGGVGWSVTIESQPQPYYYSAPPPVFYPQSPYPYGPPPSGFAPPPPVYRYAPPPSPPAYQYRYEYQERWPGQQYRDPHGHRDHSSREREWRERDRDQHHSRDRWQDNSRDRWQDNNRPGPGANHDLPKWGYGERRR